MHHKTAPTLEESWQRYEHTCLHIKRECYRSLPSDSCFADFVECRAQDALIKRIFEDRESTSNARFLVSNAYRVEQKRATVVFEVDKVAASEPLLPDLDFFEQLLIENRLASRLEVLSLLGFTHREVADWCGVSYSHLSKVNQGKRRQSESLSFEITKLMAVNFWLYVGLNCLSFLIRGQTNRLMFRNLNARATTFFSNHLRPQQAGDGSTVIAVKNFRPGEVIGFLPFANSSGAQLISESGSTLSFDSKFHRHE